MTLHPALRPTDAERVDRAVSAILDGEPAVLPPTLAAELATARTVRDRLLPVPPGASFEAALARRLAGGGSGLDHRLGGFVRQHGRLVVTGAVGSFVVSTAGVAVVAWRLVHRS
jgi:hypothetical protein